MNKLLYSSKMFLKRNGSTILTSLGAVGTVATAITAVKATPKALKTIEQAEEEKGEKLTKTEAIVVAGPAYIPTILMGTATIACIFGANVLNTRKQAALISAYTLLDSSYKEYKDKVKELYGEDADMNVKNELAKDKHDVNTTVNANKRLFYDEYSERYFESTIENVMRAEYELNRMIAIEYGVFLNEFYELLGIDTVDYGDFLGWSTYELCECQWHCWVEFSHRKVILDDGLEVTIISIDTEPSFGFEDY